MGEARNLAVILLNHTDSAETTIDECHRLLETSKDSIRQFWADTAERWFEPAFAYFGPYLTTDSLPSREMMVDGTTVRRGRKQFIDFARDTARAAGANLDEFDATIVILSPGTDYDAGAIGDGSILLPVGSSHAFMTHEFGHLLGFGHSYGLLNLGGDQDGDDIAERMGVYGDPYDIMSAESFGGASPTSTVAVTDSFPSFPLATTSGPMLSRAFLHYMRPAAMESVGKVRHVPEGSSANYALQSAGEGDPGEPELIVYHPANEDDRGRGRVYVEYRSPDPRHPIGRWDEGLADTGAERDRAGVIIHTVRDADDAAGPRVWFAGRVTFPSFDADVVIDTTFGPLTVQVDPATARAVRPQTARAHVSGPRLPRVTVEAATSDERTVVSSEQRHVPNWPDLPAFIWEVVDVVRTATFSPYVVGLGGRGGDVSGTSAHFRWYVGGLMVTGDTGIHVAPTGPLGRSVRLHYVIDPESHLLTLRNDPADGAYDVSVVPESYDSVTHSDGRVTQSTFTALGRTEGWGEDYHRFLGVLDRVETPIPRPPRRGPDVDIYGREYLRLIRSYDLLIELNPAAALVIRPLVMDQSRMLRTLQRAAGHR
jgi:hypothetical protein